MCNANHREVYKDYEVTITFRVNAHHDMEARNMAQTVACDATRGLTLVKVCKVGTATETVFPQRRVSDTLREIHP